MSTSSQHNPVSVRKLGKRYKLGDTITHDTLRDGISYAVGQLWRSKTPKEKKPRPSTEFWALKDISFDVHPGDVLGIIGRNGAGKSTLLKILSQITEPTEGEIRMRGRVASLLEVGTGFHPELSGKENVYLNGAILGMSQKEITSKYDEIVDFAGVHEFMETPVKRYSSGMRVRLAFAVAAHLEPEILIIDEVLAVGDVAFQEKCLGKMNDVAHSGRTILFVSHNMAAVEHLCTRGIVLHEGKVVFDGQTAEAIDHYLSLNRHMSFGQADISDHPGRSGSDYKVLQRIRICDPSDPDSTADYTKLGSPFVVEVQYDTGDLKLDYAVIGIENSRGDRVLTLGTHQVPSFRGEFRGKGQFRCKLDELALMPGEYSLMVGIGTMTPHRNVDAVVQAVNFRIDSADYFGNGATMNRTQGVYCQKSSWSISDETFRASSTFSPIEEAAHK